MSYLVVDKNGEVFRTHWFNEENYTSGMVLIDDKNDMYFDGGGWRDIREDHL